MNSKQKRINIKKENKNVNNEIVSNTFTLNDNDKRLLEIKDIMERLINFFEFKFSIFK